VLNVRAARDGELVALPLPLPMLLPLPRRASILGVMGDPGREGVNTAALARSEGDAGGCAGPKTGE